MFKKLALILGFVAAATTAQATTVTLNLETGYVGPGTSIQNRIDLSSYLTDYRIVDASLVVNVRDDIDPTVATVAAYTADRYLRTRYSGRITIDDYERNRNVQFTRDREEAELLMFGERNASLISYAWFREQRVQIDRTCTGISPTRTRCLFSNELRRSIYYDLRPSTLRGYFGAYHIDRLNTDGFLDYGIRASRGDFTVTGGALTLTLEAVPSTVPLPAGAVLLMSALGMAGVASRRRRAVKK